MKVVQYLVKEVNQFPSDIECMRYIATIADKVAIEFLLDIKVLFPPEETFLRTKYRLSVHP